MRAAIVDPVGIDHGDGVGQRDLGLVMVDHDQVEAGAPGLGQRLECRHAAVDRDHHIGPLLLELQQRRRVGAVALQPAIGDVDADIAADAAEEAQQQRRRRGAVDVVVAEHDDALARAHRAHQPRHGGVHVLEMQRIGQELAQRRVEEIRHALEIDVARRQQARHGVGQAVALGDGQRRALVAEPRRPAPAGQRLLDAEEGRSFGSDLRGHGEYLSEENKLWFLECHLDERRLVS